MINFKDITYNTNLDINAQLKPITNPSVSANFRESKHFSMPCQSTNYLQIAHVR